ncbi:37957_t:CDS:2 [Gigaspora margarita]|uniref:37957_t:CDS:1 n=1 Tax=Gigaspora margarita TaxID=4874 RepID=A0ABN7UY83_GIGMA|nr:37957_t:CDS:2 [Gigaspora margarita]
MLRFFICQISCHKQTLAYSFLQLQLEASSSVIQDTTEVFKNSIASVNSSIENINNIVLQYNEKIKGVESIKLNFENAGSVLGKRQNSVSGDYDSLTKNDRNESPCEITEKNQKSQTIIQNVSEKKQKINKEKQPESKATERYDDRSSLSISNNVTISHDLSTMINQEQLLTAIVTNPATQTPRTLPLRPNVNNANIQVISQNYFMTNEGPLRRNIGKCTFIVERIVPLLKAIQLVYKEYKFHWIGVKLDCIREVKRLIQNFDLIINQADGIGGPENTDLIYIKEDAKKRLKEAVFGLVSLLRNHLDKSAENELEIQTSVINKLKLSELVEISKICDWIWVLDSVSAWKCKDNLDKNYELQMLI